MRVKELNPARLLSLRGKRSREVIAHELRKRGHGTDAKAIWRYETGRSQPSARVLSDYADVLGAESIDALYGDDEDEESDLSVALVAMLDRFVRERIKDARGWVSPGMAFALAAALAVIGAVA